MKELLQIASSQFYFTLWIDRILNDIQIYCKVTIYRSEIQKITMSCYYHFCFRLTQCEEDKSTKDNQIRSLQEELVAQEELVSKLNKEKRQWADGRQKNEEELQAAEDRANHLNRVKAKLEQNLDELEDSVEREKKVWPV